MISNTIDNSTRQRCPVCGRDLLHDNACSRETPEAHAARVEKGKKIAAIIGAGLAAAMRKASEDSDRRIAAMHKEAIEFHMAEGSSFEEALDAIAKASA